MMNYRYAVIGNGRLAKHMLHYFSILKIPYTHWYRNSALALKDVVASATHVLLFINDSAIEIFLDEHQPLFADATVVHFSGAHCSERAFSAHPFMTFSHDLYTNEMYQTIPFVTEQEGPSFQTLLPGLPNPHYAIPRHQKPYYHALCVMANNFSTILWQKIAKEFVNELHIPKTALLPILQQTFENLKNPETVLTGPISRNDQKTIENNLKALETDPFYAVYQGFLSAHSFEEK